MVLLPVRKVGGWLCQVNLRAAVSSQKFNKNNGRKERGEDRMALGDSSCKRECHRHLSNTMNSNDHEV